MYIKMNRLSQCVLILVVSNIIYADAWLTRSSTPCSKEEMEEPIQIFYKFIESLQSKELKNAQTLVAQLLEDLHEIPDHLEKINITCGDEKTESINKLVELIENIRTVQNIVQALGNNNYEEAKTLIEAFHCPHLVQFTVRLSYMSYKTLDKVVELLKVLENMKTINMVNEALIYVIDDTNIGASSTIIPLMKKQILDNKEKIPADVLLAAKLNMKEMVKITSADCNKGFIALNKIDPEMADQAFYEVVFQNVTETYVNFKKLDLAPNTHFYVIGLEAFYDKLVVLEMQNSISMGKVVKYAKLAPIKPDLEEDSKAKKILENILDNAPEFAKKVSESYVCQNFEQIKSIVIGQEVQHSEHNEYTVFYNPETPELFKGKFIEQQEGELLMINLERSYGPKTVKYSIVMENGVYPENIYMSGKILSKKVYAKKSATFKELCVMEPEPIAQICAKLENTMTREDHTQARRELYNNFLDYVKKCRE
ncbi:uncharacterized protein LOC113371510 [Ctenocephalides felis]|uniref:uncharacterized protein LOC113371510 n=1 Tax=Ctenocephalides felis TaxID=7515 RepID=UPI000E6E289B|nr:uncharacterized protein LOC113371510 [Ctenocephalides felis]